MSTDQIDVTSFLPKKAGKKRNKPTDEDEEMTVVDESGIEGNVKSNTSGTSKAKRVKKADSMKIGVPIKRYAVLCPP